MINETDFIIHFNEFLENLDSQTPADFQQLLGKSKYKKERNSVCLLMIVRYTKPELLSFENIIDAYVAIPSDTDYKYLVLEVAEESSVSIKEIMWTYAMYKDLDQKDHLWESAKEIANSFDDFREMYEQTEPGSSHNLESYNLLGMSVNTQKQQDYMSQEKETIRQYQRVLVN